MSWKILLLGLSLVQAQNAAAGGGIQGDGNSTATIPLPGIPKAGQGKCYKQNRPQIPASAVPPCQSAANMASQIVDVPGWNLQFPQQNAIASWYKASLSSDSTNGHSWCSGYPYKDTSVGFAPSLSFMMKAAGGNYDKANQMFCGLEAVVTNLESGASKTMYIIDAFDDKWVRYPG
ncbi:hypothetical protein HDU91_003365, partial [Kappamyces sp. JEL0680]